MLNIKVRSNKINTNFNKHDNRYVQFRKKEIIVNQNSKLALKIFHKKDRINNNEHHGKVITFSKRELAFDDKKTAIQLSLNRFQNKALTHLSYLNKHQLFGKQKKFKFDWLGSKIFVIESINEFSTNKIYYDPLNQIKSTSPSTKHLDLLTHINFWLKLFSAIENKFCSLLISDSKFDQQTIFFHNCSLNFPLKTDNNQKFAMIHSTLYQELCLTHSGLIPQIQSKKYLFNQKVQALNKRLRGGKNVL